MYIQIQNLDGTTAIVINGRKILAAKHYSVHPDDTHLVVVLCGPEAHRPEGMYVVWTYNRESKGAGSGHYVADLASAMAVFGPRGRI